MNRIIREYPLATVMTAAVILRLIAVLFSKGYMASDDQFETIDVAYNWLQNGFWSPEGTITWGFTTAREIARFPLYALSLWAIMKVYALFGIDDLDTIMYGVRAAHALVSLVGIWAVYRLVKLVTQSKRWAFAGGMFLAAHAAMPFLSVRNLIEMVAGTIWILALLLLYLYSQSKRRHWLVWAGLISGLAWMIRFEMSFAILPVPFVLWYRSRSIRPAAWYSLAVLLMLALSGLVDYLLMGSFGASTVNHLRQVSQEGAVYATSFFIYPAVVLVFFLLPPSLIAFAFALRQRFWKEHSLLVFSSLSFILLHALSPSRQERYMIPLIPVLTCLLVLAVWRYYGDGGRRFLSRYSLAALVGLPLMLNLTLILPFSLNYGHRGLVAPLVAIASVQPRPTVLFVTPERGRIFPYHYGGFDEIARQYVRRWSDLSGLITDTSKAQEIDYVILYPPDVSRLDAYRDSVSAYLGKIQLVQHFGPSSVDYLLHKLNPRHNSTNEAWLYKIIPDE